MHSQHFTFQWKLPVISKEKKKLKEGRMISGFISCQHQAFNARSDILVPKFVSPNTKPLLNILLATQLHVHV